MKGVVMTWGDQGRLKVLSGKFGALAIGGRDLKTGWRGTVRVKPFEITDEYGWGGMGLSGSKLENSDLIHVGPLRIQPSQVGMGGPRVGPSESWQVGQVGFFYFAKKI
jgi:hypothetical protein